VGAAGMGAEPDKTAQFREEVEVVASAGKPRAAEKFAPVYGSGPGREQLELKDSARVQGIHRAALAAFSQGRGADPARRTGAASLSVQLVAQLEKMTVPTLIIHGDEDRSCLGTGAFLKRTIPSAGLMVFPKTGHTINLEEPALFNFALQGLLHSGGERPLAAARQADRDAGCASRPGSQLNRQICRHTPLKHSGNDCRLRGDRYRECSVSVKQRHGGSPARAPAAPSMRPELARPAGPRGGSPHRAQPE